MAMKIVVEECLKCGACVMACPREAISEKTDASGDIIYVTDLTKCTECKEEGTAQCKNECPVPECIVKAS